MVAVARPPAGIIAEAFSCVMLSIPALAALLPVEVELSHDLLRHESGQWQARSDDQVHTNADVAQAEIVQSNVRSEHTQPKMMTLTPSVAPESCFT